MTEPSPESVWWLLQEVAVLCRRATDRQLAPLGTSSDQVQALRMLTGGERRTVGELSRSLGLERNSGSQLVERLVQRGLVRRVRAVDDRRRVYISISDSGEQLLERAGPASTSVAESLLHRLTSDELAAADHALASIRRGAKDALSIHGTEESADGDRPVRRHSDATR